MNSPTQSDKTLKEIVYKLYNRAFLANEPDTKDQTEAIAALTAREERIRAEAVLEARIDENKGYRDWPGSLSDTGVRSIATERIAHLKDNQEKNNET